MEAKAKDGEQRGVGPIVHMRADSDSMLESMFAIALKPPGTEMPLQKPMRMRNLPASFWKPPPANGSRSPSCHSRENSHDELYSPSPQPPPPLHSVHSRAHSSPATLQQTLAAAQAQAQAQQQQQQQQQMQAHHRQASYDVNLSSSADNLGPLPPGWEATRTPEGQVYFMNHITKTTQWEDPRQQILQQGKLEASQGPQPLTNGALGPLPHGWEQGVTREGEIYFINHVSKKTTWYDPRIPMSQQAVPLRVGAAANAQQQRIRQELRLQRLENERRDLQLRQAELKRLEQSRRLSNEANMQAAQEMLMRQSLNESTNADPFLNSSSAAAAALAAADLHNRQESADSGLGMGSNFNLGSIPEDISGMESMDTGDLDTTLTGESTPTAGAPTDDHLMTSLPVELGDDLSSDIMESLLNSSRQPVINPVVTTTDTLTWL